MVPRGGGCVLMATYPGLRLHLFSDLDGTLADSAQAMSEFLWREWALELLPSEHAEYSFVRNIGRRLRETGHCGQLEPFDFADEIGADVWERLFCNGDEYLRMLPVWDMWSAVHGLAFISTWFVTARPAGIRGSCISASRQWLDRWGLLRPDSFLVFSREIGREKADVLQQLLYDIKNARDVLSRFRARGETDTVLVLEDKPEELLSLVKEAGDYLKNNTVDEGIRIVVMCVPQPWNSGLLDGEVWAAAGHRVFGDTAYLEHVREYYPQVKLARPPSLPAIGATVRCLLAELISERKSK